MSASLDPTVHAVLRLALALLFAAAAGHKLRDRRGFRAAVAGYALLPEGAVAAAASGLAALELATAGLLVVPGAARAGALLAAGLLGLYSAAVGANLLRGRATIDCGCGGPAQRSLGPDLLVRNALLLAAAFACALEPAARVRVAQDLVSIGGGVAVLALLYAASETALANRHALRADRSPA